MSDLELVSLLLAGNKTLFSLRGEECGDVSFIMHVKSGDYI